MRLRTPFTEIDLYHKHPFLLLVVSYGNTSNPTVLESKRIRTQSSSPLYHVIAEPGLLPATLGVAFHTATCQNPVAQHQIHI